MKNKPLFSVVTCAYNSGKYLQKNIDSVESQIFDNYEHIFIDGNSTDETVSMIKKYQQKYPDRIKLFSLAPKGISNAMNEGIRRSSGQFIIHLHSDDSFYSNTVLHEVSPLLNNNTVDWVYGKINTVNGNRERIGIFPTRRVFQLSSRWLLGFFNFVPHQAVFIRKSVFDRFGLFDEKLKIAMDYDYWLRISKKTKWRFINVTVSNFMISPHGASSSIKNRVLGRAEVANIRRKHLGLLSYAFSYLCEKLFQKLSKLYR